MKKLMALALVTLGVAVSARAQWIVYDPGNNAQQILSAAEDISKCIHMIENQVQRIQTLTDQLKEFKRYEDLFGDPKSVLLSAGSAARHRPSQNELGHPRLWQPGGLTVLFWPDIRSKSRLPLDGWPGCVRVDRTGKMPISTNIYNMQFVPTSERQKEPREVWEERGGAAGHFRSSSDDQRSD